MHHPLRGAPGQDRTAQGLTSSTGVEALGSVLGIWAHPDDETYLAGGLLGAASRNGQRTANITATGGEHGTAEPGRWPPTLLARRRRAELARSLAVLGVHHHRWLGYEDGTCAWADGDQAVERVLASVAAWRPDTIITFGPDGVTGHVDHRTVGAWATEAAAAYGQADLLYAAKAEDWVAGFEGLHQRVEIFAPGLPQPIPTSGLCLDLVLDEAALDRKIRALRQHGTQVAPLVAAFGPVAWREWVRRESFVAAGELGPTAAPIGEWPFEPADEAGSDVVDVRRAS